MSNLGQGYWECLRVRALTQGTLGGNRKICRSTPAASSSQFGYQSGGYIYYISLMKYRLI